MSTNPWYYFLGGDYAPGGVEGQDAALGQTSSDPDDFALVVLRARLKGMVQLVYQFRQTGIDTTAAAAIIHQLHKDFRFHRIILDPGGGGIGVRNDLRRAMQERSGGERFPVTPICTSDDMSLAGVSDQCLTLFRRGDPWIALMRLEWLFEAALINKGHDVLRTTLANGHLSCPAPWEGWANAGLREDVRGMRDYLNRMKGMSEPQKVRAEIDLMLAELLHVDRAKNRDGTIKILKGNLFKFSSKYKKDAAYALMYAHWGVWVWRQIEMLNEQNNTEESSMQFEISEIG